MRNPLRAFVVDDEPAAVRRLARLLKETGRVVIIGTATDPLLALEEIPESDVDVLFLDIKMPTMDGFELLERLPANPLVVLVTAHDEFALRAFEAQAMDYILKPVTRQKLDRAIAKLDRLSEDPTREHVNMVLERLSDYRGAQPRPTYADRITTEPGPHQLQLIEVSRVSHFLASGKATLAFTDAGEHLVEHALGELERRLDPKQFVRVHRGTLINLTWVDSVKPSLEGRGLTVRLKDRKGTEVHVAPQRARMLKERIIL